MNARILIALDGSKIAEQVLPHAQLLAQGLPCRIDLLRVVEPPPPELTGSARSLYQAWAEEGAINAQNDLEKVAESLERNGLIVSSSVQEGDPASIILAESEKEAGTLIAASTHGRSGLTRWLMGSVTNKVLRATVNPMLLVRAKSDPPKPNPELRTVIVPLDGSSVAEEVLPHVVALANRLNLKVNLLRVLPTAREYARYIEQNFISSVANVGDSPHQDFYMEDEIRARNYLCSVKDRLRRQGVSSVEDHLLRGHAASIIIDTGLETPNSMVAMTTHGGSGLGRWVLGSVTDRVVRHCGVPVLVIRSAMDDTQQVINFRPRPV